MGRVATFLESSIFVAYFCTVHLTPANIRGAGLLAGRIVRKIGGVRSTRGPRLFLPALVLASTVSIPI